MRSLLYAAGLLAATLFAQGPSLTRPVIFQLLRANKLLNPDRRLVHFHHTCNLRIDGRWYPVVDVQEIIPGVATARGDNLCVDNKLVVYGDLRIDGVSGEGNVLALQDRGARIELSHVEPQD